MKIEINSININYEKIGSGAPLLLLHGNGEDLHIFDILVDKLKNNYTIYSIDSRNHGLSDRTEDFSYQSMANDLKSFIETLHINKPSVIGFSDGAIVALLLELDQPNIFNKMILLGLNLSPDDFTEESLLWLRSEFEKNNDPLFELMLTEPNIDIELLKNVQTETLLYRAENDIFKDTLYDNIVTIMPNAKLKIASGHDHSSYIVESDYLYQDVLDFIK